MRPKSGSRHPSNFAAMVKTRPAVNAGVFSFRRPGWLLVFDFHPDRPILVGFGWNSVEPLPY